MSRLEDMDDYFLTSLTGTVMLSYFYVLPFPPAPFRPPDIQYSMSPLTVWKLWNQLLKPHNNCHVSVCVGRITNTIGSPHIKWETSPLTVWRLTATVHTAVRVPVSDSCSGLYHSNPPGRAAGIQTKSNQIPLWPTGSGLLMSTDNLVCCFWSSHFHPTVCTSNNTLSGKLHYL